MTRADAASFLVIVLVAACSALLVAKVGKRFVLPVVVVELLLGIVVGPQVLDLAQVDSFTTFFSNLGLGMLFFFAGYERSERTEPAPAAGFDPDPAALAQLVSVARNYGYTPGSLTNPGEQNKEDNKYLLRLDWHPLPGHRLSARYSRTRGQNPNFADYSTSGRVSLSDHWYVSRQNLDATSAHLFSRWGDRFSSAQ